MPRLFTALEIPTDIALQLSLLQNGLQGARWIERESLHITLRFIGDVETSLAREIAVQLECVKTGPFQLQYESLDVFSHSNPHSLFAGVKRNEAVYELAAEQERICQQMGLAPEQRRFKPHTTIARIRGAKNPEIANYLSQRGGFVSPPFSIGRFVLLSSKDSIGGGPYRIEESYQLVKQEILHA
jgi:2'-5' RNA ligase